jgi:hypothetical protein
MVIKLMQRVSFCGMALTKKRFVSFVRLQYVQCFLNPLPGSLCATVQLVICAVSVDEHCLCYDIVGQGIRRDTHFEGLVAERHDPHTRTVCCSRLSYPVSRSTPSALVPDPGVRAHGSLRGGISGSRSSDWRPSLVVRISDNPGRLFA